MEHTTNHFYEEIRNWQKVSVETLSEKLKPVALENYEFYN